MPTPTYTPLANLTLTGTDTQIDFTSISGTYRDLILIVNAKEAVSASNILLRINSDTASNYSDVRMGGDGTNTISTTGATTYIRGTQYATVSTTDGHNSIWHFMDYSATDKHKTVLIRSSNAGLGVDAVAGRWASTSAITGFSLINVNFAAGSTFALYGIAS